MYIQEYVNILIEYITFYIYIVGWYTKTIYKNKYKYTLL